MPFGGRKPSGPGGKGKGAAAGDKQGGQRRGLFRRRKVCKFCADRIDDINYKDVKLLSGFVPGARQGAAAPHLGHLREAPAVAARGDLPRPAARAAAVRVGLGGSHVMEVILRDHVEHVGRRGEVVKVADGFARNFLLPRKLALPATEGNKQLGRARAQDRRGARGRGAIGAAEAIARALDRARLCRSPARSARTTSCTGRSPTATSPIC